MTSELEALKKENARLTKAFMEVCEERDHWHSRSIISEVNEMALREDNARFKLNTSEALAAINDCSRPSEDGNSQLFWNWEVEYIAGLLHAALSLSSQETKQPELDSQSHPDADDIAWDARVKALEDATQVADKCVIASEAASKIRNMKGYQLTEQASPIKSPGQQQAAFEKWFTSEDGPFLGEKLLYKDAFGNYICPEAYTRFEGWQAALMQASQPQSSCVEIPPGKYMWTASKDN